jgi:hypothetical protein
MEYGELGWQEAVVLGCAMREGLLEAVADGSRSADEVANQLGASSRAVYALLRRAPSSVFLRKPTTATGYSKSTKDLFWTEAMRTTQEAWSCTASS